MMKYYKFFKVILEMCWIQEVLWREVGCGSGWILFFVLCCGEENLREVLVWSDEYLSNYLKGGR